MQKKWIGLAAAALLFGALTYFTTRQEPKAASPQPLMDKVADEVRQIKKAKQEDPKNTSLSPEEETQRLLKEAANKRFKVNRPEGMLTDDRDVAEDLTRQVAVEMLLETLIREKIDKNPDYITETEARLLKKEPRLMTLSQEDAQGELRTVKVLVADTRACQDRMTNAGPIVVKVAALETDYCMHPTLEYPGGFDPERPLQLAIGPVTDKGQFADMDRQWDRMLKIEMRQAITAEFVPRYKESGALTL
jgi:hypothetical protein